MLTSSGVKVTSVRTIVRELVDQKNFLNKEAGRLKIEVLDHIESGQSDGCWLDSHDLRRVLDNVLNNAIDAVETKELPVITIVINRVSSLVCVDVIDNGEGISEDLLTSFNQGAFGGTTKVFGHGVGLVSCFNILYRAGGRIIFSRLPIAGTSVRITIPAK